MAVIGHEAMIEWQKDDRPFAGIVWGYLALILGTNPLGWHVFALLTRWLSAIALWFLLREIWPRHLQAVASITLLFLLYPGIQQEPRAFIFGLFWLQFALIYMSYYVMIKTVSRSKYQFLLIVLGLTTVSPTWLMNEYFIGLEVLRPLVLWQIVSSQYGSTIAKRSYIVFKHWIPYLSVLCIYLAWRLFFFETTREEVNPLYYATKFALNPIPEILYRLEFVIPDIVQSTLLSWTNILSSDLLHIFSLSSWLSWMVGLTVAIASYFLLLDKSLGNFSIYRPSSNSDQRFHNELIVAGLVAILVGMVPIWLHGVFIGSTGLETRYGLPAMTGACCLLYGLLSKVVGNRKQITIVLSLLLFFAAGSHIKVANDYRHEWLNQKQLYWQLAWRIPSLAPGTVIWIHQEGWQTKRWQSPFDNIHYAAPINLIYRQDDSPERLNYWASLLEDNDDQFFTQIRDDYSYRWQDRNLEFSRLPKHNIVVTFFPPGCLKVLDKNSDQIPYSSKYIQDLAYFSNTDLISQSPSSPAPPFLSIFGPEPKHDWCYYYQKIDLARQFQDWEKLDELRERVSAKGFVPKDVTEWSIYKDSDETINVP